MIKKKEKKKRPVSSAGSTNIVNSSLPMCVYHLPVGAQGWQ
jgi:hypothetical protein